MRRSSSSAGPHPSPRLLSGAAALLLLAAPFSAAGLGPGSAHASAHAAPGAALLDGLDGAALAPTTSAAATEVPVTLRGSMAAMRRQHAVALEQGFRFVRTPAELSRLVAAGELVRLQGNEDYGFRQGVGSMVARPEMGVFLERLGAEYRAACGEKLVVTSLTRPTTRQPRNAHRLSVHPAGIAVDLRVSRVAQCRRWLEDRLLALEELHVLDVTRERYPPHYHVALFPEPYIAFVGPEIRAEREAELARERARARLAAEAASARQRDAEAARRERREAMGLLLTLLLPLTGAVAATARRRSPAGAGSHG